MSKSYTVEEEYIDIEYKIYGKGENAVYLYYYECYRELAELKSEDIWPCKIGRTDRDPLVRILSQTSTALPEQPTVSFIIKTEDSLQLEKLIHSYLLLKNRKVQNSPGTEWFFTNSNEILSLLDFLNKN